MSSPRRSATVILVLALVAALAAPSVALGTVTVSSNPLSTPSEAHLQRALISGSNVAFEGVLRFEDPIVQVEPLMDVWSVDSDQSIWMPSGGMHDDFEDFRGDWVAYRLGMMGEGVYVYNLTTKQQWAIGDTTNGMFVHSVRISGNTAVWLDGYAPDSILKTMNLTTGEVETEGLVPSTDIAFEGNKVVFSRSFLADTNLFVYDLDTNETSNFVTEEGPQVSPDIRNGLVVWLDGRAGWAIYSKPLAGGEQQVLADEYVSDKTDPSIGDRFVTWTRILSPEQGQDVWAHDLATGINFAVAEGNGEQVSPDTDGSRLVYADLSLTPEKIIVSDVAIAPPVIKKLAAPKSVRAGADGKFTLTVSNPDAADAQSISWDWGDESSDSSELTGSGKVQMSHTFSMVGQHTVIVTVTDASGIAVTKTAVVTVK